MINLPIFFSGCVTNVVALSSPCFKCVEGKVALWPVLNVEPGLSLDYDSQVNGVLARIDCAMF